MYKEIYLDTPAHFYNSAYKNGVDMMGAMILFMLTKCTLQRSLKEIILDDNDDYREQFADIKREEMEHEARMEARDYEKDDFSIINLQDND